MHGPEGKRSRAMVSGRPDRGVAARPRAPREGRLRDRKSASCEGIPPVRAVRGVPRSVTTAPLPPRFADFLARLGGHAVDYLIVGGYALVFHGYDHPVPDLDLWVRP